MPSISRQRYWLAAAALASVVFDALLMVIYAASIGWVLFGFWRCAQRLRGQKIDVFTLIVSMSVPLLVNLVDFAVQAQVDRDMRALSQSRSWVNAKVLPNLLVDDSSVTWVTRTRVLTIGFEGGVPVVKGRGFPGYILRYNLESGEKSKYPW
jgi:hypothetical protein